MAERKRVAVIGAGPCGLGAVKALKEEELEPVCFERTGHYGGLWRYHDDDTEGIASVMKTTIINTSKEVGAMSDFPPPKEFPNYMHHTMMYEYIGMMAEKCDALRHVNFHHEVVSVVPAQDYEGTGRWVVTTKNNETGDVKSETFDGVMVCVGHHVFPNMPKFPGMEDFQGRILHTHSLKKADGFQDERVVVVGVGNSGMDAAVEISSVSKQVYLSSRRGTWVLPRVGPKGYPFDFVFIRRWLNFFFRYVPYSLVCYILEKQLNARFNHSLYNLKPKHRVLGQHPTVSDSLPIKLLSGTVVVRGPIKTFTEHGIIFEGEQEVTKVDSVIFATGYKVRFPFLSDDILPVRDNRVQLYKYIFPPDLVHPTLAILGLIQPSGPGFPVGEMQCRYSARVMSGKCSLPTKEIMLEDIREKDEANRRKFVDSPRHTVQVDFIGYQDELGELIGVRPNFWKMAISDPKLFWICLTGPCLPYQFRLQGPHSWEGARDAILNYKERVVAPLQPPGFKRISRTETASGLLKSGLPIVLIPLLFWFFISIMSAHW